MWVLIDNYDSFTWILHDYLLRTGHECVVYRNDEITLARLSALAPDRIIISPGPETPEKAGITMQVIDHFHARVPILGVCLGHQALGVYFGARLARAAYPMHGKVSMVRHNGHPLFHGLEPEFQAMRYHSLVVDSFDGLPIAPIAHTADGAVMALAHKEHPCIGVQFHPESVGTGSGPRLLRNWAAMYGPATGI